LSSPEAELSRMSGVDTEGIKLKGQKIGWPNDILSEKFSLLNNF
jgi:hypothetical protein